jgi:hypothetical protein
MTRNEAQHKNWWKQLHYTLCLFEETGMNLVRNGGGGVQQRKASTFMNFAHVIMLTAGETF